MQHLPRPLTLAAMLAAFVAVPSWAGDVTREPLVLASLELLSPKADVTEQAEPEEAAQIPPEEPMKVIFTDPLPRGGEGVEGFSLETLIQGSPLFAPIEGLPKELWQDQTCSHCHKWSRDDLCDHGKRYVGGVLETALSKRHPYGGGFKRAIHDWALDGCR